MASLFNQQISATYQGLLKTTSNGIITSSLAQITDGSGNGSQLYLSTASINFYNAYSFPNADGSANQVLKTNGSGVLTWQNDSLSNTLNFLGGNSTTGSVLLSSQNFSVLGTANEIVTTASNQAITLSFPTAGVTLPNGSVATTQTASDNSTKVATTAYVTTAVSSFTGDVTKTGTITQNQIAVWNDSTDELRSDATITVSSTKENEIILLQPYGVSSIDKSNYNIGGGNTKLNQGLYNTGFGKFNLSNQVSGNINTAIGYQTLWKLASGTGNTVVGAGIALFLTTGNLNTFIGGGIQEQSQNNNVDDCVAVGYYSNRFGQGDKNTSVGTYSYAGVSPLTTGELNTVIGYRSGFVMTTGSKNVIIGSFEGFRAAAVGGLPEYSIITSSNNIVLSDGDGNVRQSFDSNGDATFSESVAVSELLTITQANAGTTANKGLKLTNTTGTRNWNITAGRFDTNNDDFTIRCADTDVDALFISPSGNATFGGDIIARGSVTRNISFLGTGASPESLNAQIQYDQVNDTTGQLFFKTSNSGTLETRLTISSVGNVGIGNNNPSRPLDITADSGAVALKLRARVSNDFAFMSFYNHQNTVAWAEIAGTGTSSAATSLDFYVGATKKMSISSSGLATFQSSVQEKIKLIASSSEYLSLAFANNSGTTQWEISKGNSNELYFYRGGGGVDQGIKLTIESGGVMVKNGNSDSARIIPATDNVGYLGESSHRWQAVYAVNGSIQTSDRNEKTLITTSDLGLDFILKLEPISYKWKVGGWDIVENGKNEEPTKTPIDGKRNHYGLIAQQVKEVIGDKDFGGWVKEDLEDDASMESLRYAEFISPMIKAIQEQQTIIEDLKLRIETLEG